MSIRCKMDGGNFYNRIQSGSFQHQPMSTALRVQHGPEWLAKIWQSCLSKTLSNNRIRQRTQDTARKMLDKYKGWRMLNKGTPIPQDSYYGDPPPDELQRLCKEVVQQLQVSESEQQSIAIRVVQQAND